MSKKTRNWQWTKTRSAKQVFSLCRLLHIYISTALFSLLILFSFTGITLNHPQWLGEKKRADTVTFPVPENIANAWKSEQKIFVNEIRAFIANQTGLKAPKTIQQDLEVGEVTLDYPLPAGYAFVSIFLEEGLIELEYEKGNIWALMNDLHKGRHSGVVWSWVIDISAILMIFFAVTGLVILFQQARYRKNGLWLTVAGSVLPIFIYFIAVPSLN